MRILPRSRQSVEPPVSPRCPAFGAALSFLLLAGAVTGALAAANPYRPGQVLCTLQDRRISESSGIAAGGRASEPSGQFFWTHNDSGDGPRLYAVSSQGQTLTTLQVPGAEAVDWEDMARAPGPDGAMWLYLADIGDNNGERSEIVVYGVPEPVVDPSRTGGKGETQPATRYELRYPDGPRDAETVMVHPVTGRLFIVSKGVAGSQVYAAPRPLRADAPNLLTRVGRIDFSRFPNSARGLRQQLYAVLATGGDIRPDGKRVVVRTYTDAYEWPVVRNDVAAAFRLAPIHVPLPSTRQGEAIGYGADGKSLLVTTEGVGAPVHQLRRR